MASTPSLVLRACLFITGVSFLFFGVPSYLGIDAEKKLNEYLNDEWAAKHNAKIGELFKSFIRSLARTG
jgi:hypothetical protein